MTADNVTDSAATVIIGQRLRPGCDEEFLAWQHDLNTAASRYPGFVGADVSPPTAVQPEWTVVYRFDTVANLRAWLNSATRQDRLIEGRRYLDGTASLWNVNVGHGREEIVDAAAAQMRTLASYSAFGAFANTPGEVALMMK